MIVTTQGTTKKNDHLVREGHDRVFQRRLFFFPLSCSRWLTRDDRALFPRLPERTRLFRPFVTHQDWTQVFLAAPTVLGGIDTSGIALIHPMREGRSPQQIGPKACPTIAGLLGANSVCSSISGD